MPRPKTVDDEVLRKLEESFSWGCNNRDACVYADIPESTFYDYVRANPEFSERIQVLRAKPVLEARKIVMEAMKDDPKLAWQYLQKARAEEFGEVRLKKERDIRNEMQFGMSETEARGGFKAMDL